MDTPFAGIGPTRTVPLAFTWTDSLVSVADSLRETILETFDEAGLHDELTRSATLDDGTARLIALAVLGNDPFSGGQLLLRVNCELHDSGVDKRYLLRLTVLPYPGGSEGDAIATTPMLPEYVTDIVKSLILRIKELAPERILVEHELRD
jgi:hypothetical protein